MSILLDALKKSEAQRQLGETPTLHTPLPGEGMDMENGKQWIPIVMLVLTACVITWIGVVQYSLPEETIGDLNETDTIVQSGVDEPGGTTTTRGSENPAGTPVKDYSAPAQPEQSVDTQASMAGTDTGVESGSIPDQPANKAPDEVPLVHQGPNDEGDLTGEDENSDRLEDPVTDKYKLETISYWQLPQSLRDELPEIRITVLVYAENPEDRFLLINGERMREADELDGGLGLEEIQRDRAIFTFRKYRFHLKS